MPTSDVSDACVTRQLILEPGYVEDALLGVLKGLDKCLRRFILEPSFVLINVARGHILLRTQGKGKNCVCL